jgi:hypothetical protein
VRGWRNDADGLPWLISTGLGTSPQPGRGWSPTDSGYRTGTGYNSGAPSARPGRTDDAHVSIDDHVDDAVAG